MNTFDLGFPPVDAAVYQLSKIEYKKHLQTFAHVVITIAAYVAAVYTVLATKYQEHNMNKKLQQLWQNLVLGIMIFYEWILNIFIPECKALYKDIINLKNRIQLVTVE
jgi:EamA domain-containing membrane protein RarD